tara:strand:+ start:163 stop:999 length:837 start_codon:yes stop_codon:yes gene_type:complete
MQNNRPLNSTDYFNQSNQIINIINSFTTILRNTELHTYNLVNNSRFNPPAISSFPSPSPIITRPRNIFSTNLSNTQPFPQTNTFLTEVINNLTPVRVFPTPTQIRNSTIMIPFEDIENPINTRCPIRHEDFQNTDVVMQIRHCRHNFNSVALNRWFENAVRCPVCRYDIREYNSENENSEQDIENQQPEPYSSINNINEENNEPEPEPEIHADISEDNFENDLSNNRITVNALFSRNINDVRDNIINQITNVVEDIIHSDPSNNNGIISIEYQIENVI